MASDLDVRHDVHYSGLHGSYGSGCAPVRSVARRYTSCPRHICHGGPVPTQSIACPNWIIIGRLPLTVCVLVHTATQGANGIYLS